MSAAHVILLVLVVVHFVGLCAIIALDPAHLVDAARAERAERSAS
jgi:hypothetical protein